MNKKRVNVLILLFLFFIFAGCGKNEAPAPVASQNFFFKVQFVVGDVKISGTFGEIEAKPGDLLKVSDVIVTGKKSVADVVFGTSGIVRINENSRVAIKAIADRSNNDTVVDVKKGKVFFTLGKLGATGFKVHTNTVVVSVRGTSFTVLSDKNGSKLSVLKGTVALNPVQNENIIENKTADVITGNRTNYINTNDVERIIKGKMEIPVVVMTPAEKMEIQNEVKEIRIDDMPDLSPEAKDAIKKEIIDLSAAEEMKKYNNAVRMKKLAEEKKKKEEELKKKEEEKKRLEKEKKRKRAEQLKKEKDTKVPSM